VDERRVLSARLYEYSRLSATATAYGVSVTQAIDVQVDAVPVVTITDAPASLAPGEARWVSATVSGGLSPLAFTWMKNGTTSESVIARIPSVEVIGDSVETDLYLQVTTALGLTSNLAKVTIAPRGVALHAAIDGPSLVTLVEPGRWFAHLEGSPPPSLTYRWTRTCLDPGCEPVTIGTDSTLLFWFNQNFDLGLTVATPTRSASAMRRIRMHGVPTATLIDPPDWVVRVSRSRFARKRAAAPRRTPTGGPATDDRRDRHRIGARMARRRNRLRVVPHGDVRRRIPLRVRSAHGSLRIRRTTDPRPAGAPDRPCGGPGGSRAGDHPRRPPGSAADLRLLDIAGREVAHLYDDTLPLGIEFLSWNSGRVRSGVYLLSAVIANERITRRLNIVR
jgi:hypothetical protein